MRKVKILRVIDAMDTAHSQGEAKFRIHGCNREMSVCEYSLLLQQRSVTVETNACFPPLLFNLKIFMIQFHRPGDSAPWHPSPS